MTEKAKKDFREIIIQSLTSINKELEEGINLMSMIKPTRRNLRLPAAKITREFLKNAKNKQQFLTLLQEFKTDFSTKEQTKLESIHKNKKSYRRNCYQRLLRKIIEDSMILRTQKTK